MVSREDVKACLIFLVFIMIFTNIFTFLLFWRVKLEKKLDDFRRSEITHRQAFRPQQNAASLNFSKTTGDPNAGDFEHSKAINSILTSSSLRFSVKPNGGIQIYLPEYMPVTPEEAFANFDIRRRLVELVAAARLEFNNQVEVGVGGDGNRILRRLRRTLGSWTRPYLSSHQILDLFDQWPLNQIEVLEQGYFGQVLSYLSHVPITQAFSSRRGTQLKLEVLLASGNSVYFKPAWYQRDVRLHGDAYGGKDRHFGEIASFYLAQLLGYRSGPIVVGRKLNLLTEILPYASLQLNQTFSKNTHGDLCFYGVCYYCSPQDMVCAKNNLLEGAFVLHMKQSLKLFSNPWQRTYRQTKLANWEWNMAYCSNTVLPEFEKSNKTELLLDIIAISIFDFLIGNADRHHLDVFTEITIANGHLQEVALIDNGKSFGDPFEDYLDILAPLYQCCMIRDALTSSLKSFQSILGKSLESVTVFDQLYPLLTPPHLKALDRRLNIVLATINMCQNHPKFSLFE